MVAKSKSKKKSVISVDFTGVSAEGGGRLLPEGPVKLELVDIEEKEGESSGQPYLSFTFEVPEGEEFAGTKAWDNMSLQPQSLWKLRGFLEAAGVATEDGPMDIDQDELIGLVVTGNIIHEDYKGKSKHRIDGYVDDEPAPASATSKKKKSAAKAEAADESDFKVDQEVTFKDGKKTLTGTITEIDGDEITVTSGDDEYALAAEDLTLVEAAEVENPTRRKRAAADPDEDKGGDWKKKQRVKFKDGKKTLTGIITAIEDDTITVKVDDDEYEVGPSDLSAA